MKKLIWKHTEEHYDKLVKSLDDDFKEIEKMLNQPGQVTDTEPKGKAR